jgi:hypothetical protein
MNDGVTTLQCRGCAVWVCDVTDYVIGYVDANLRGAGVKAIRVSHEKSDVVSTILGGLRRPCAYESSAPGYQNLHQTLLRSVDASEVTGRR